MDYYKIARVLKPIGLKGELKLKPYVDNISRFAELEHVFLQHGSSFVCHEVLSSRTYKQFVYLKISGFDSLEQAETLRGSFLYIDKANAKKPEGTHFIADLIGMKICGNNGTDFGILENVLQTGATDIYSVNGPKHFLFAAAPHILLDINEETRIITIDETRLNEVAIYD